MVSTKRKLLSELSSKEMLVSWRHNGEEMDKWKQKIMRLGP
ncbi:MAG: hypothetical protein ACJ71P_17980 [Nitrososphaeraceae archaeon]